MEEPVGEMAREMRGGNTEERENEGKTYAIREYFMADLKVSKVDVKIIWGV